MTARLTGLQPRLQALWASALDQTATLLRPTQTRGSGGGRTTTWTTVGTYAARWQPPRYRADEGAGAVPAIQATDAMRVCLPAGTVVRSEDRIRHPDGSLWDVRGSDVGRSNEFGVQVDVMQSVA